jgi:hypothetical protein
MNTSKEFPVIIFSAKEKGNLFQTIRHHTSEDKHFIHCCGKLRFSKVVTASQDSLLQLNARNSPVSVGAIV